MLVISDDQDYVLSVARYEGDEDRRHNGVVHLLYFYTFTVQSRVANLSTVPFNVIIYPVSYTVCFFRLQAK